MAYAFFFPSSLSLIPLVERFKYISGQSENPSYKPHSPPCPPTKVGSQPTPARGGHFTGASYLRWRPPSLYFRSHSLPLTPASFSLKPESNKVGGQAREPRPEEERQKRTEMPTAWHLSLAFESSSGREGRREERE